MIVKSEGMVVQEVVMMLMTMAIPGAAILRSFAQPWPPAGGIPRQLKQRVLQEIGLHQLAVLFLQFSHEKEPLFQAKSCQKRIIQMQ